MTRIPMNRTRPLENPYLVFEGGGFKYRVLKAYGRKPDAPMARWYVCTSSPFTFGDGDWGDEYIQVVTDGTTLTHIDPDVPLDALPTKVRGQATFLREAEENFANSR